MAEITPDSAETQGLLRDAAGGDRRAFDRLLARHRKALRQFIELRMHPKMRGRVDSSDVVQETQLEVFRRLADFVARQPMPFHVWLRKTAYERVLMARRQHVQASQRAVGREVPIPDRSSLLHELADALAAEREQLAVLEARNAGKPIGDARGEMEMVVATFRYYAGAPERLLGDTIPVAGGQALGGVLG